MSVRRRAAGGTAHRDQQEPIDFMDISTIF